MAIKPLRVSDMRLAEECAFASGQTPELLMERAGKGMAEALHKLVSGPARVVVYAGRGHNGGDALVAAAYLKQWGWDVVLREIYVRKDLALLPRQHWDRLIEMGAERISKNKVFLRARGGTVLLLDGLLGIGGKGALRGVEREACREISEAWREHALVAAVDVPSGLDADTGMVDDVAVRADWTLTVEWPKTGLLADGVEDWVGRLVVVPAGIRIPESVKGERPLVPSALRSMLPRRERSMHKGRAGRLLVIAGSQGMTGAAELVCRGALRSGAGLVTLAASGGCDEILAMRVPAEAMVRRCAPVAEEWLALRADAVVIGPGLSPGWHEAIRHFLSVCELPVVVDAEALRALVGCREWLGHGARLLTPHDGEMAALYPELAGISKRKEGAELWRKQHPQATLLWKGARTLIACESGLWWNTTGHPGMATGGMGDVLSGVAGAWLAQGLTTERSAVLAAWLCGRAAELAASPGAWESVLPTDVVERLGEALRLVKECEW